MLVLGSMFKKGLPAHNHNIRTLRRVTEPILVLIFLAAIILTAWRGVHHIEQETRHSAGKALNTVLLTTQEALHLWAETRINDAKSLAARPVVVDLVSQLQRLSRSRETLLANDTQAEIRAELRSVLDLQGYLGFFVIAPDAVNLASMRDANVGIRNIIAERRPDLLARVFDGESIIVPAIASDVPLNRSRKRAQQLQPTMFAAVPLVGEDGTITAAFTVRIDPIGDFSGLTSLGRIGKSGETYIIDRDGYMLSESRFDFQLRAAGLLRFNQPSVLSVRVTDPGANLMEGVWSATPPSERPLTVMAREATAGHRGLNTRGYPDYRGVPVFGAWLWDNVLGVGLTTEIDAAEAMQPYMLARNVVFGGVGITTALSVLLVLYLVIMRSRVLHSMETGQAVLEANIEARTKDLVRINHELQEQVVERIRTEEKLKLAQVRLEETNEKLEALATIDDMTGVANRRAFEAHIGSEWRRCQRTGSPISLLLFDVDFFKQFNDSYGHQAGDTCLGRIGEALMNDGFARRPTDLVARYGGEEFAVVLSGTDEDQAASIGEAIRLRIADLAIPNESTKIRDMSTLTVSVGVASMVPEAGSTPAALIKLADEALYEAKASGRNCVNSARPTVLKLPASTSRQL